MVSMSLLCAQINNGEILRLTETNKGVGIFVGRKLGIIDNDGSFDGPLLGIIDNDGLRDG